MVYGKEPGVNIPSNQNVSQCPCYKTAQGSSEQSHIQIELQLHRISMDFVSLLETAVPLCK